MTGVAIACFVVIVLAAALRAFVPGHDREANGSRPTRTPLPLLGLPEPTLDLGAARRTGPHGRGNRAERPTR